MIRSLTAFRDRFFGRGHHAITVPPMDGAFRPNTVLEEAPDLLTAERPGHLSSEGDALWLASGTAILRYAVGKVETLRKFDADITGFARSAAGEFAITLADGSTEFPPNIAPLPDAAGRCVTGLAFDAAGGLFVTIGSAENGSSDWSKDLLENRSSGSLLHLPRNGEARQVAKGLAWAEGLLVQPDGSVVLSESSACRITRIAPDGSKTVLLAHLPAYPAGLTALESGYALCFKAPRNQLIEFILRERSFVQQMISTVPREHWIAPSLYPQSSFLEPLQGGALKQLGIMKPWAPSRSIGLVARLSPDFLPVDSYHSRADGTSHGTTSCCRLASGELAVASVGAARVLKFALSGDVK